MSGRVRIVVGVAVAAVILVAGVVAWRTRSGRATSAAGRPNILVIMTDDQTLESVRTMARTSDLLGRQGTSFLNYTASFPNCCPSRATYLTGQYAHNSGVQDNVPPNGGFAKLKGEETLPVWLQRAGYRTASIGKYLNGWGAKGDITPPPGWDHWFGLIDPTTYRYYGYSVSDDGNRRDYGDRPADYQTDVLGAEVVRTITERGREEGPWFVSWTPLAPHAQAGEVPSGTQPSLESIPGTFPTPAERHKGTMAGQQPPRTASYDQADVSRLPAAFRENPRLNPKVEAWLAQDYQQELEALQAVDEWVGRIADTLRTTGQLDNTVILFTSDNGYFHGEHRLAFVKVHLYEPAVHLPLMVRGGPFPAGRVVEAPAGNVDLTPTVLALAGATSPLTLDGRDLAPLAADPGRGTDRGMLLENLTKQGAAHAEGIRTTRYKYLTNEHDEEELYDLQADPDEVVNLAADPGLVEVKADLAARLAKLVTCKGAGCEGADGRGG